MDSINSINNIFDQVQDLEQSDTRTLCQALPGSVQSKREINSILNDEIWKDPRFRNENILAIRKIENGYELQTTNYIMKVDVNYESCKRMGPAIFTTTIYSVEDKLAEESGVSPSKLQQLLNEIYAETGFVYPIKEILVSEEGITLTTTDDFIIQRQ